MSLIGTQKDLDAAMKVSAAHWGERMFTRPPSARARGITCSARPIGAQAHLAAQQELETTRKRLVAENFLMAREFEKMQASVAQMVRVERPRRARVRAGACLGTDRGTSGDVCRRGHSLRRAQSSVRRVPPSPRVSSDVKRVIARRAQLRHVRPSRT